MYKSIFFNDLQKFHVIKNKKEPATKWTDSNNYKKVIDVTKYNIGLPTGKINNIIVLDIDYKDDGIDEFNKYIKLYGDINTFKVKSPNNGYHYYFLYKHSDESIQHLIDESLKNSSKYRGKGIDIRSNGGYIVGPNSTINGKMYEIINDINPIEIPENLIKWLLIDSQIKITKKIKLNSNNYTSNSSYKYDISDEQLKFILSKLDNTYYDNYDKWLIVLTILKNLNKYFIFDEFSKKSKKYNPEKNIVLWNHNKGLIDINFLIIKINKEKKLNIPLVQKYKLLPTFNLPNKIKSISLSNKYLDFDYNIFNNYNTIIIQSDTGTGKTTHISKHIYNYIKNNDNKYQVISIVNLINLANQQIKTFSDNGLKLSSYQDEFKNILNDDIVVCINSILIFNYLSDDFYSNKIIYIDEINSFLEYLTHNDILNKNIKLIYEILIKFIKKAHKVIVSDAHIKNNVFELLKFRDDSTKIYINNDYKKYNNVNAIRIKDENMFFDILLDNISKNKYFLFGCDSCSTITKFYYNCIKKFSNKEKDFILITAEHKFNLINANEQFKNKFVFYSPSIVTGVDFSIDNKQDHFIYIKGNTINPTSIYQQSTRNRNIDTLYYYGNYNNNNFIFNSIDCVKSYYKNIINANNIINNVCRQFNENDESYIIENTFFNLFCFNEYILDCFNTNKLLHFESILKDKGFTLSSKGYDNKFSKEMYKELITSNNSIDIIKDYLQDNEYNKLNNTKYESIRDYIQLFNLEENDLLKYKTIITDKFERNHYFNFIKLFYLHDKAKKQIVSSFGMPLGHDKAKEQNVLSFGMPLGHDTSFNNIYSDTSYDIKQIDSIDNKINIIKKLYKKHNIKYLSLDKFGEIQNINISNDEYTIIKHFFRTTKKIPSNNEEFKKFIITLINNIIGNLHIIDNKITTNTHNVKIYKYFWNLNKIKHYTDLYNKYNINQLAYIHY